MAEEAIEKELTNCTICLDTYTDPKILQCFHVFCKKCLVKLVERDHQGQLSLSCPICRQVTPVPARGTTGLQSAFHINHLLDLLDKSKAEKQASADSKAGSLPSALCCSDLCCSDHGGRELELFCETCGELVCMECAIKGGKHHSHDYKSINESFERFKEEVAPFLEPMEMQRTAITKVLAQLDRHCAEIAQQQGTVEAEIQESSKRLHEIIDQRQDQLIGQLDQITRRKLKSLATQRDQIETFQAQLSSCLEFMRESLKADIQQRETLVMKTRIVRQVQELASPSQPNVFTLSTEANIVFSGSADAAAVCESYGRVYASDSPDLSKCAASSRGTEKAVVGKKVTAELEITTMNGEPCTEASIQVELVSEINGGKVMGSVGRSLEQRGQGQYVISYQPTVKGRHQLHITADGQHIRGSPFGITVTQPVENLNQPILTLSKLGGPVAVAVSGEGGVVVVESRSACVSVFSPCGEKLRSFGAYGPDKGQFKNPSGVAVDGEGNLLVLEQANHRIQKFTADGNFLQTAGCGGREALQFYSPVGITYSSSNNKVYVADTWNHRVQVLTSDLEFISMFGKEGSGKGLFMHPRGVATDSTGRVYVADSNNHRIQIFTAEGRFLRLFGQKGAGRGELCYPWSVAVDANGMVYVSETWNLRVSVFTSKGRFVAAFGQFCHPSGLAVDDAGVVYVCDDDSNTLQLY